MNSGVRPIRTGRLVAITANARHPAAQVPWSRRVFELSLRGLAGLATLFGVLAFALLAASLVPLALALLYVSSTLARLVWEVAGIVPAALVLFGTWFLVMEIGPRAASAAGTALLRHRYVRRAAAHIDRAMREEPS